MYRTEIQPNARSSPPTAKAGEVTHIIVDPRTNHVSELVVGRAGREWLVPAGFVESTAAGAVRLRGASDALLTVPFDLEEFRATNRRPAPAERAEARTDAVSTGPAAVEAAAERSTPPARRTGYPLVDLVRRQQAFTTDADGVIRIPLRREEVTVEKRWYVVEEVDVTRHALRDTERFTETVRYEDAVVEEEGEVRHRRVPS